MTAFKIWTATCKGCQPWVRMVRNSATNEAIVQELHEDTCHVFPKMQRGKP